MERLAALVEQEKQTRKPRWSFMKPRWQLVPDPPPSSSLSTRRNKERLHAQLLEPLNNRRDSGQLGLKLPRGHGYGSLGKVETEPYPEIPGKRSEVGGESFESSRRQIVSHLLKSEGSLPLGHLLESTGIPSVAETEPSHGRPKSSFRLPVKQSLSELGFTRERWR